MNDTTRPDPSEIGWGQLPEGTSSDAVAGAGAPSAAAPAPPPGSGWTAIRVVLLWLVLAIGTVGFVGGAAVVLDDLSDTTDDWHGLGIAIGSFIAVPSLCVAALAGFGLRAHRRRGPDGSRVYAYVLGGVLLLSVLMLMATPSALVPATLGGLLVASAYADRKPQPPATR